MNSDRPLPADVPLETLFVSAVLWTPRNGDRRSAAAAVPPDAFFSAANRAAWKIIRETLEAGTFDPVEFFRRMSATGHADAVPELSKTGSVPRATLGQWARKLLDKARARRIIETGAETVEELWGGAIGPAEAETRMADLRVANLTDFGGGSDSMAEAVGAFREWRELLRKTRERGRACRFGIPVLDYETTVLPSYGLVLARTSHGKTAFALSVALNQAKMGMRPLFFTLEQPRELVVARLVSLAGSVPLDVVLGNEEGTPEDRDNRDRWLALMESPDFPLSVADGPHDADRIAATCHRLRAEGRADCVFIDQFSRIRHRQRKGENQEQAWTATSNRLAALWQELRVPVVALGQLNAKTAKDHPRPEASHIKNCGSLLEDACWVFVLDRPEAEPDRFAELERKREAYALAGDRNDADGCDWRGRVKVTLAKDRNAMFRGEWPRRIAFDKGSGRMWSR